MEKKIILVTGIGGNVAQGIIRNINSLNYPIEIIGTNVISFTAGNYLCDKFFVLPYANDKNYIKKIKEIILKNKVDLIIPTTDLESYYLALNRDTIDCPIATSDIKTLEIYLDKYKTYIHHQKYNIPFAKTFLPSKYKNQFINCIAKPKEGRGSRGLVINPKDFSIFKDSEYLIQELHKGIEITTAFYVNKENKLHGFISLERELENGATSQCKVITKYNSKIEKILIKIIKNSSIKGSANLQFIVNEKEEIFPFEINCRISGTNSIRHNFGFQDVKYTLQEFLYAKKLDQPKIINGKAIRVLLDVIYLDPENESNTYIY